MADLAEGGIPLRERRAIGDEWKDFARRVISPKAPVLQVQEMKRAYYAGAQDMFVLLTTAMDEDREPTELDLAYVSSIAKELEAFMQAVREGRQ